MDQEKTGALIAQKRKEKGMTQLELASRLGVSNKAVSRWETGGGFPDISILEKLADELGVTVTALLSGEEEAAPEEKLVLDSTRHFSKELTDKKKRYRRICIIAVAIIVLTAAVILYTGRHKGTAILPQQDTVITYEPGTEKENIMAAVSGSRSFYYNVLQADDVSNVNISLELWDGDGLKQTWALMGLRGFAEHESNPLVVQCTTNPIDCTKMDFSVFYCGGLARATVEPPYKVNGLVWGTVEKPEHVKTGGSVVLLQYSLGIGKGAYSPRFIGQPDSIEPMADEASLLLRIDFK